jgi:hypothetical protein
MPNAKPLTAEQKRIIRLEQTVANLDKRLQAADAQKKAAEASKKSPTEAMHNQLLAALPPALRPLNVGEYSSVIWSYWFPMTSGVIAENTAVDVMTTITQEAAFIMTHMFCVAHLYEPAVVPGQNRYTRVPVTNLPVKLTLVGAQSTRQFMLSPEPIELFGDKELPRKFPSPNLFLPNSTITARIQNDSPTAKYRISVVLLGARVRVDEASKVLGTMIG